MFEVIIAKHVAAGTEVENGYGRYMTAPQEQGTYTLFEVANDDNTHYGWRWEKEFSQTLGEFLKNNNIDTYTAVWAEDTKGGFGKKGWSAYGNCNDCLVAYVDFTNRIPEIGIVQQ